MTIEQMNDGFDSYIGIKRINAKKMTRKEYNDFRGWELPQNENGEDDGFLVEYLDGGKPNTESYAGYISWSPKEVFENAYTKNIVLGFSLNSEELEPYQIRVLEEHEELMLKMEKLKLYLDKQETNDRLLESQYSYMFGYMNILRQRIKSWEIK